MKSKAVIDGEWSSVSTITSAATRMCREVVFMTLLHKSLPTWDARKANRFLMRLAAYEYALNTLRQLFWRRGDGGSLPLFTGRIAISLLPPNHKAFQPLSLDELSSAVMTVDEHRSFRIHIGEPYTGISTDLDLEEHCEIQLVRFYIENPDTAPVLPYLGISKPSCFQCSAFLGNLRDPGLPGSPIKFSVRGERAKVYGRWLPPDDMIATEAIRDRVQESLRCVTDELKKNLRQMLRLLGYSTRCEFNERWFGLLYDECPAF